MGIKKQWLSLEEFEKIQGGDWTPEDHIHARVDITDFWAAAFWASIPDKPSTFPPSAHTLASHSTKAHSELSDAPADAHHAQLHAAAHHVGGGDLLAFASITGFGDYLDQAVKQASSPTLANLTISTNLTTPKVTIGAFYLNSLIANNKVPDSYKWHGYTPAGLTIGHVLKATGASAFAFQANNLGGLSDVNLVSLEEGETIAYDQGLGEWIDAWGVEYDNPRLVWKMYTDFFSAGTASNDPWVGAVLIDGTMAARAGETNHPGQVRLNSGGSVQSGYRWMTATDCILLSGAESSQFVFKSPINLSNVRIRIGFQDSLTDTAPTDGMYIDINGTTLKGITRNNGSETVTGTTWTISTSTWYRVKMALSTDKATATFWLYNASGTQLWTNTTTTNIPTGAGRTLGHGVVAWIDVAAGQVLIDLDMMVASQAGYIIR